MSIDYLRDLERDLMYGKDIYATQGMGRNQWIISPNMSALKPVAERTAAHKKFPVDIVRLVPSTDAVAGESFLVPVKIGEQGARGEAMIEWASVETREASELMRDLRYGQSPYFGMQVEETIVPKEE